MRLPQGLPRGTIWYYTHKRTGVQRPLIIGIAGYKRSGKDTFSKFVAQEIEQQEGKYPKPEIIYFADLLKKSAFALLSNEEWLDFREWADIFKEKGLVVSYTDEDDTKQVFTGREILQRYGTEAHRNIFGEDFWIDQVLPLDIDCSNRIILIPDLRFENEAIRVRTLGGIVVRINRETFGGNDNHASELPLSEKLVDFEIDNNESLDYLRSEVKQFCFYNIFPNV